MVSSLKDMSEVLRIRRVTLSTTPHQKYTVLSLVIIYPFTYMLVLFLSVTASFVG